MPIVNPYYNVAQHFTPQYQYMWSVYFQNIGGTQGGRKSIAKSSDFLYINEDFRLYAHTAHLPTATIAEIQTHVMNKPVWNPGIKVWDEYSLTFYMPATTDIYWQGEHIKYAEVFKMFFNSTIGTKIDDVNIVLNLLSTDYLGLSDHALLVTESYILKHWMVKAVPIDDLTYNGDDFLSMTLQLRFDDCEVEDTPRHL
jgi:hypothetical protein